MTAPNQLDVILLSGCLSVVILNYDKLKPCPKDLFVILTTLVMSVSEELDRRQVLQKLFGHRLEVS